MNTTQQPDYTLVEKDLTGLWLQPGFVEGIVSDRKRFAKLPEAYQHIFRRNLEYAVALWNGLPVRFSYQEDLAEIVVELIEMLSFVQQAEAESSGLYEFETPNLHTVWRVEVEDELITIEAIWRRVAGNYKAALNQLGMIRMRREEFLCEWKLLLEQFAQAMADSEARLTSSAAKQQLEQIRELIEAIPRRGRFYRYSDSPKQD